MAEVVPDGRVTGQGACDFKAVMMPVLISLEDEQALNLCLCANQPHHAAKSWKPKDDSSTFKVQQTFGNHWAELQHFVLCWELNPPPGVATRAAPRLVVKKEAARHSISLFLKLPAFAFLFHHAILPQTGSSDGSSCGSDFLLEWGLPPLWDTDISHVQGMWWMMDLLPMRISLSSCFLPMWYYCSVVGHSEHKLSR